MVVEGVSEKKEVVKCIHILRPSSALTAYVVLMLRI